MKALIKSNRMVHVSSNSDKKQRNYGCLKLFFVNYSPRAYSFGHLLKTVELVEDEIPFFWYPSTENGRLRRLQIAFHESPFFWSFCFR